MYCEMMESDSLFYLLKKMCVTRRYLTTNVIISMNTKYGGKYVDSILGVKVLVYSMTAIKEEHTLHIHLPDLCYK